jgi:5-hydroxyisourate hydrolase-like protein (transthyretin family)
LDEHDAPIGNAHVWAGFAHQPYSEAQTDRSGRFVLTQIGAPGARNSVTVQAIGFSADQQNVDTNELSKPIVFRLSPVGPLRFHIVDEAGEPIKGADVALQMWWGGGLDTLILRHPTDADGRIEFESVPKGELEFCALKQGYRSSRRNKLFADNEEHTFVLYPERAVTGRVTDAESGEPISSFTLTRGYSQIFSGTGETQPIWDLQDRWPGANGSYKVVFDEEDVPRLKVEAEGYEVFEVKPQFTNSVQTVCDFQLRRADTNHTIRGVVLLPSGEPAANVEVALCTFRVGVWVKGVTFEKQIFANE